MYLIRKRAWGELVIFSLMPLIILLLLSKYSIVLGRNMSLVLPFAFLFMTYGLMEAERFFEKMLAGQRFSEKAAEVIAAVLVLCNIVTVLGNYRYDLTYNDAADYIAVNIPAGARFYCTSYMPVMEDSYPSYLKASILLIAFRPRHRTFFFYFFLHRACLDAAMFLP